jgi:uncharacterized protein (TIGR00106 family)
MSVLVEFAMFPSDKGASVSAYVGRIIKMMKEKSCNYKLSPMGTCFECDSMEEALEILNQAYRVLEHDCERVYSTVKFDIRKGKSGRLLSKIQSIEEKIGCVNK